MKETNFIKLFEMKRLNLVVLILISVLIVGCSPKSGVSITHSPAAEGYPFLDVWVKLTNNDGNPKNEFWPSWKYPNSSYFDKLPYGTYTLSVHFQGNMLVYDTAFSVNAKQILHTITLPPWGLAGGMIFYDKGVVSDGWKYLEAAPVNSEFEADWIDAMIICENLIINEFSGWYLPNNKELHMMYKSLKENGFGEFKDEWYWSSSDVDDEIARTQNFFHGGPGGGYKKEPHLVRAIRKF